MLKLLFVEIFKREKPKETIEMPKIMTATEARKKLFKIIDECAAGNTSYILTKKGKAVRVIDEGAFEELILAKRLAENPRTLKKIEQSIKEFEKSGQRQ